jgi:hypothetical protein
LGTLGAGALSIPFIGSLVNSAVLAQAGASPLRFVALYHPHGAASPLFRLRAGETEDSFDISYDGAVLAPFDDAATYGESFKDRIIVLDGIDLSSAIEIWYWAHSAGVNGRVMRDSAISISSSTSSV